MMDTAKRTITRGQVVELGDQVCATLMGNGVVLARVNSDGCGSVDEVIRRVLELAGRFVGMARLTIRNNTRGWQMVRMLATTPAPMRLHSPQHQPAQRSQVAMPRVGRQYLIPWAS